MPSEERDEEEQAGFTLLELLIAIFLFGVVLLSAVWGYQRLPLIPIRDARLNESIGYENETP